MRFVANETFESPETESVYIAGLHYTVRPGNGRLARLVEGWLQDGKVAIVTGGMSAVIDGKD